MPNFCLKSLEGSRQRQGRCASLDEVAAVEHRVPIIAPIPPQARLANIVALQRGLNASAEAVR